MTFNEAWTLATLVQHDNPAVDALVREIPGTQQYRLQCRDTSAGYSFAISGPADWRARMQQMRRAQQH
jgi:hypothetical protein